MENKLTNKTVLAIIGSAILLILIVIATGISQAEKKYDEPGTKVKTAESDYIMTEKAMFAAGCFWGVEKAYRQVEGVVSTAVGYSGGTVPNPTYHDVCSGQTGHAEVIEIEFDPAKVSYEKLVEIFFKGHNPTTLNSQGPDFGSQYRSAIFYYDDSQKEIAERLLKEFDESGLYPAPIVTEITKAGPFYRAEEYHQQYMAKNNLPGCGFHLELK